MSIGSDTILWSVNIVNVSTRYIVYHVTIELMLHRMDANAYLHDLVTVNYIFTISYWIYTYKFCMVTWECIQYLLGPVDGE